MIAKVGQAAGRNDRYSSDPTDVSNGVRMEHALPEGLMNGLKFWWFSSDKRERLAVLAVACVGFAALAIVFVVKAVPSLSCSAANEARDEAVAALKEIDLTGPEDRCEGYRKISALLARYRTDWRSCVPGDFKDATAALDIQARFYDRLVRTCD